MLTDSDRDDWRRKFADLGAPGWVMFACRQTTAALSSEHDRLRHLSPAERQREWGQDFSAERIEREGIAKEQANEQPWPTVDETPTPLGDHLPPVPRFNTKLLPDELRVHVVDIAERMQVPVDMVAVAMMSALSVIACTARTVRPKQHDTWRVYPVLWGATIAPAGSKKTPAMTEAHRPLLALEERERKRWAEQQSKREAEQLAAQFKREAAQDRLKKSIKKGETYDITEMADELAVDADQTVRARRYMTNDTTTEKIADLVNRAGADRRSYPLGVFRDELIGLFNSFDRDGREGDRAFYLEGWSVANKATDRIGRGEVFVRDLCLVVFGNATPGPFETYVREATKGPDADGFLQRLQLLVYPDPIRDPRHVDREPNRIAQRQAMALFERLDAIREVDEDGKPIALRFDSEAQPFFNSWISDLEKRVARADEHHALISHFSKYRSLMPSLALVCHLANAEGAEHRPISLLAAQQAAEWCTYLEAHARRVYAIAAEPERSVAVLIAKRIVAGKLEGKTTARKIQRALSAFDAELVGHALDVLEELGWLRRERVQPVGGGRPTEVIHINPKGRQ